MNRNYKYLILCVINIILIVAVAFFIYTQKTSQLKIAYVKTGELLQKYQGMIDASKEYQQKTDVWKANVDTLGKELEQGIKDYEKNRNNMSVKERQLTEELLRNKQQQYLQYQDAIQKKMAEEDKKMTEGVVTQVNAFLKEYGAKHEYTIIWGATQVGNIVYAENEFDITVQVLGGLNKEYEGK